MNTRPVPRLLRRSSALVAVLVLLSAAVAVGGLVAARRADRALGDRVLPLREANSQVLITTENADRDLNGYLLTGEPTDLENVRDARAGYQQAAAQAQPPADPEERRLLHVQAGQAEDWWTLALAQAESPGSGAAVQLAVQGRPLLDALAATNADLDARTKADSERLRADINRASLAATSGAAAVSLLAVALVLWSSLRTARALADPLRTLENVIARRTGGDYTARVPESGPPEVRALARAVNALADESDRMYQAKLERQHLRSQARAVGLRIRDHLVVDEVVAEAATALADALDADHAYVALVEDHRLAIVATAPGSGEPTTSDPAASLGEGAPSQPDIPLDRLHELYAAATSWTTEEIRPVDGGPTALPQRTQEAWVALGAVSALVTPFGIGAELLGTVILLRCRPGHPWRKTEVGTAESIAADLGRAVQQAQSYEQEGRLVEELRKLDRVKSEFLSTVSHELRTPLTSIAGYVELLLDEDPGMLSDEQTRMLEIVDRNTTRLRILIEDLLTLSRIESGAFRSAKRPVDLGQLMRSVAAAIAPSAAAAHLTVDLDVPATPLVITGDADQLDRALINLLSNAVKFTPDGGRVTLGAAQRDGVAVLCVADTGIGIPEQDRQSLFTRFFRASNATERAIPGTGLGLTIVRTIVENHAGEIEVESVEGRGTTITVQLPLTVPGEPPAPSDSTVPA